MNTCAACICTEEKSPKIFLCIGTRDVRIQALYQYRGQGPKCEYIFDKIIPQNYFPVFALMRIQAPHVFAQKLIPQDFFPACIGFVPGGNREKGFETRNFKLCNVIILAPIVLALNFPGRPPSVSANPKWRSVRKSLSAIIWSLPFSPQRWSKFSQIRPRDLCNQPPIPITVDLTKGWPKKRNRKPEHRQNRFSGKRKRNRTRRNRFVRNKFRPEPEPCLPVKTLLKYRDTPSLEDPSEPKAGVVGNLPCTNCNRTEPSRGHPAAIPDDTCK